MFVLGMNMLSFYIMSKFVFNSYDNLSYHIVPVIMISLISFIVGAIFIGLFDDAVEATL